MIHPADAFFPSRHRFSLLTAGATFLLIFVGGLVTSTGSSLSVPDWPLSYGQFFPPMVGGVLYEHGHRMVAGVVALATLALAIWTWREEPRSAVRYLAALALALMPHTSPPTPSSASGPATTAELLGPVKPPAAEPPKSAAKAGPAPVAAAPATTVQPEPGPPAHLRVGEPRKEQLTPVKTMTPSEPKPSAGASARSTDISRWSELRGTVHAVGDHEVVVRVDDGQLVPADLSGLRGVAVALKPGSPIVVYGTRDGEKFQAIGLIQQEIRPLVKPVAAPQRH